MADEFGQELIALLPRLRRFALSLCKRPDAADDLLQTTCAKALKNRMSYQPGSRMDAWLFRIMRNTWIDEHRQRQTQGSRVDLDDALQVTGEDGERAVQSKLMLDSTAKAIDALPDDQREVLVLVCVEDLSYRETAELLDVPIGTVMSRLARARLKISETLGIDQPENRSVKGKGHVR